MLARIGYCRTTPREIIYGSKHLGGAGLFHLYDDQGYGQLKTLLKMWRSPGTQTGKLHRILLSWWQYCVCTQSPILQDVHTKWPRFESKWISSIHQYLQSVDGYVELLQPGIAPLRRIQDAFIMDTALAGGHLKPASIRKINYCRMYLNVLLLSDIVMPCGTRIDPADYDGTKALYSINNHNQVHQPSPGKKAWQLWKRFLNTICYRSQRLVLKQPLRDWRLPTSKLVHSWPFFMDPHTNTLYCHVGQTYTSHRCLTYDFDKEVIHHH